MIAGSNVASTAGVANDGFWSSGFGQVLGTAINAAGNVIGAQVEAANAHNSPQPTYTGNADTTAPSNGFAFNGSSVTIGAGALLLVGGVIAIVLLMRK